MDDLLFLVHRIPYPPDKGDKIRSWNMLRHLARSYRVHVGCFIDDPHDWRYEGELRKIAASCWIGRLDPRRARLKSLTRLLTGEALTIGYYQDPGLARWTRARIEGDGIRRVFAFSSSMAQYVFPDWAANTRRVFDFVDVDSDKWRQYAARKPWPTSWVYEREARRLLAFERLAAARGDVTLFVSDTEAALFRSLAPETADRVRAVRNGVNFEFFNPSASYQCPDSMGPRAMVFTGAMDYWANVDAVAWFAREVMPLIRAKAVDAEFWIVGANPTGDVRALASLPGVKVTGRVPDVRPFLAHAACVVAPLRLARGVQNKVLEAMSMAKLVVATQEAAEGIDAVPGRDLMVSDGAAALASDAVRALAGDGTGMGLRARALVVAKYGWEPALAPLGNMLEQGLA